MTFILKYIFIKVIFILKQNKY